MWDVIKLWLRNFFVGTTLGVLGGIAILMAALFLWELARGFLGLA